MIHGGGTAALGGSIAISLGVGADTSSGSAPLSTRNAITLDVTGVGLSCAVKPGSDLAACGCDHRIASTVGSGSIYESRGNAGRQLRTCSALSLGRRTEAVEEGEEDSSNMGSPPPVSLPWELADALVGSTAVAHASALQSCPLATRTESLATRPLSHAAVAPPAAPEVGAKALLPPVKASNEESAAKDDGSNHRSSSLFYRLYLREAEASTLAFEIGRTSTRALLVVRLTH